MEVCMRECIRCKTVMIEKLNIMVNSGEYGIDVREKGIFKDTLGKIKCAVCPNCGYIESYIDDTKKIKELISKNK